MSARRSGFCGLVLVLTLAASRPVVADEPSAAASYGVTTVELTLAGVFALNFGTKQRIPVALNLSPLVLAPLAAYGADRAELDPTPALAIHGAGWLGLDLFLIGALLDGRDKRWGLRAGKFAWTLGALGTLAGGVVGATAIDGSDESGLWLAAPPAGFIAGGVLIGGILVLAGGVDGDDAPGQFATGAIAGLTIGLTVATVLGYRGFGDTDPGAARVEAPRRWMVGWGAAF